MVDVKQFVSILKSEGIDFFTGVPDSLLKSFCAYIQDTEDARHNIIAANEGGAIGLAAGHYLASGKTPCVYMQNSGIGNAVNPLLSLVDEDVYKIPMLLIIGWRGEPGVHDEPQHVKQGKVTLPLLETMGIPYAVLPDDNENALSETKKICGDINRTGLTRAIVIRKGIFSSYTLQKKRDDLSSFPREKAIEVALEEIPSESVIVSTTGMISRELFELREKRGENHDKDFLTVGSMGHASQIALGIALERHGHVICFDGDGASLMHMGSMAIVGNLKPDNFVHVIFNNGAHDSVGGQPTVAPGLSLGEIARAVGYGNIYEAFDETSLREALRKAMSRTGLAFVEIKVSKGARKDLGRPTSTPIQNKQAFMQFLSLIE